MIFQPPRPREQTASWFRSAGSSAEGLQHRWIRGDASLDVLLPDGIGERPSLRPGVTGGPTLPAAGGTQAKRDRRWLRAMVAAAKKDRALLLEVPDAENSLDRLATAGER